jgi:hypothetical protein
MLRQMVRRWLSKDEVNSTLALAEPQPYSSYGVRASITGIANGYLVSVGDTTTYIATLTEVNDVLPGLIAKERMSRNAQTGKY